MQLNSMKTKPRLGFIGAGGYARIHLKYFSALADAGRCHITAVADPTPGVFSPLLEQIPGLQTFEHFETMLAQAELDGLVICTPIHLHEAMTLAGLKRGLPLLLEKPPVPTLSQINRLLEADGANQVMVGFQHVYSRGMREAEAAVASGSLGPLQSIRTAGIWPRDDSYYQRARWAGRLELNGQPILDGPCTNAFSHFVNNLCRLAGAGPAGPQELRAELWRARRDISASDTACAAGRMANGINFAFAFTHASSDPMDVRLCLQGENGKFTLYKDGTRFCGPDGIEQESDTGHSHLAESFLRHIDGDLEANLTPLESNLPYVTLTENMLKAARGVRPVHTSRVVFRQGAALIRGIGAAISDVYDHGKLFAGQDFRLEEAETLRHT